MRHNYNIWHTSNDETTAAGIKIRTDDRGSESVRGQFALLKRVGEHRSRSCHEIERLQTTDPNTIGGSVIMKISRSPIEVRVERDRTEKTSYHIKRRIQIPGLKKSKFNQNNTKDWISMSFRPDSLNCVVPSVSLHKNKPFLHRETR